MKPWRALLLIAAVSIVTRCNGVAANDLVPIPGGEMVVDGIDEPARTDAVAPFFIQRTEVTNADFAAFVAATGYVTDAEKRGGGFVWPGTWRFEKDADWRHPEGREDSIDGREDHPVVQVSQRDAIAYCAYLGVRLPSEAEWVMAARGTNARRYPWGDEEPMQSGERRANFGTVRCCALDASDGYLHTAPVGSYPAGRSPFGLEDMAGNVWEWTSDIENGEAIIKGGGFGNNPDALTVTVRHDNPPRTPLDMVGFRCAGD